MQERVCIAGRQTNPREREKQRQAGTAMRGYFAVGVLEISKSRNMGALMRTAHAFGAAYTFSIGSEVTRQQVRQADTSKAELHLPYFDFASLDDMTRPRGMELVGVELTDDAIELPSFHHPLRAAYILGPEKGSLTPDVLEVCDHVLKIPTRFCVNVALAAGIVLYDRHLQHGAYPPRPVRPGGPSEERAAHVHGGRFSRTGKFS